MQFNIFILFTLLSFMKQLNANSLRRSHFMEEQSDNHSVSLHVRDYYEYRHVVAEGVQKALDECREKFKWDQWNCPKKAFLDILDRSTLPSNKEFALTRALIASGIVMAISKSCSLGISSACECRKNSNLDVGGVSNTLTSMKPGDAAVIKVLNRLELGRVDKFTWKGCDESVKLAFKVSKTYLELQDVHQDEASKRINEHNYEVGRLAVKRSMSIKCKCHGTSGTCEVKTCWPVIPELSEVGKYLKKQYRLAAKVGAMSAEETSIESLQKELMAINYGKLVFADASPDYCYENPRLGINGTLGRYCSKTKFHSKGIKVGRDERDSCHRLCTKCGYKTEKVALNVLKQCDCKFQFCCEIVCKKCPEIENTYRCARHS